MPSGFQYKLLLPLEYFLKPLHVLFLEKYNLAEKVPLPQTLHLHLVQ
ncbi:hypothetical protein Cabys_2322 [Caldithrix abyssi DSM 13497]|uniref:Uncharacterized protein n=1 Tax=Caldithrix abyssi DSM 13497 TaxID=880073 RepID=A0A1J1C8U5_CALAY|nr:hypothetical protein Cabys_2322 [Caldithrix abyssi DSM 13497]